jgi:hypothetical protein
VVLTAVDVGGRQNLQVPELDCGSLAASFARVLRWNECGTEGYL